jgi:hypothetical protein
VADCLAALEPGGSLWERFLEVVEDLHNAGGVSEEDFATLRYTVSARRVLMEETLGDDETLTVASIPEILRRAKEAQNEEMSQRLRAEAERGDEAEQARTEAEHLAALTAEALETERLQHEAALEAQQRANTADLRRRIGNISHRRARRISIACYWGLVLVLLAAVIVTSPWSSGLALGGGIAAGVVFLLWLVAGILNLAGAVLGISVSALVQKVQHFLETKIEERTSKSLEL